MKISFLATITLWFKDLLFYLTRFYLLYLKTEIKLFVLKFSNSNFYAKKREKITYIFHGCACQVQRNL